jgi:nuclear GTP-binding protein
MSASTSAALAERVRTGGHDDDVRDRTLEKGQSRRIWAELYKVVDCSDVVLEILDARDPMGTRCTHVERQIARNHKQKQVVLLLNKCDLVPPWVTRRWVQVLSAEYPTLAFHASINKAFGKGALIQLLRQFAKLHSDKKQISVGLVGYPNVGKSSVINALRSKRVCKAAPVPGETKVWQFISLMRRINLIDCPGVVYSSTEDSETDIVLKGVVRCERLQSPSEYIPAVLDRVRKEYVQRVYEVRDWTDAEDFLTQVAARTGRLLKGGEPDIETVAKSVLFDFHRGKLPHFVPPPPLPDQPAQQDQGSKPRAAKVEPDTPLGSKRKRAADGDEAATTPSAAIKSEVEEVGEDARAVVRVGQLEPVVQDLNYKAAFDEFRDEDDGSTTEEDVNDDGEEEEEDEEDEEDEDPDEASFRRRPTKSASASASAKDEDDQVDDEEEDEDDEDAPSAPTKRPASTTATSKATGGGRARNRGRGHGKAGLKEDSALGAAMRQLRARKASVMQKKSAVQKAAGGGKKPKKVSFDDLDV